jgi:hypothetical protein
VYMKRALIAILITASFNVLSQQRTPVKSLGFDLGLNQFERGYFQTDANLMVESKNGLYRYYNYKLGYGIIHGRRVH